ncbi:MAG: GIY-YIG nuclease family protein [Fibrobacter sp.]|nr:GIY-YIG nuclease family protein [Fibrobacter sp.]
MNYNFYVYILTNKYHTAFYTGVTNDLFRRVIEHKIKINEGFTNDYNVNRLVHYELFFNVNDAIAREKRLKRWNRQWKINLIEKTNANWIDLSESIGITEKNLICVKKTICSGGKGRSPTKSGKTFSRSCKTR